MGKPQLPADGSGPLLERDYWAVIEADVGPRELADRVAADFEAYPPPALVRFRRREDRPLEEGAEMDVEIFGAGTFGVRVVHRDANSLTLATLLGHPEAGRITFGAYRHRRGGVVFHIRSRARASSRHRYLGFLVGGDPMQTTTWSDFIDRLAAALGGTVRGAIHVEKRRVGEERGDRRVDAPTFIARGA